MRSQCGNVFRADYLNHRVKIKGGFLCFFFLFFHLRHQLFIEKVGKKESEKAGVQVIFQVLTKSIPTTCHLQMWHRGAENERFVSFHTKNSPDFGQAEQLSALNTGTVWDLFCAFTVCNCRDSTNDSGV